MNAELFLKMFIEYLHEHADEPKVLEQLTLFLNYGWGNDEQTDLIAMLIDNDASYRSIKALITALG